MAFSQGVIKETDQENIFDMVSELVLELLFEISPKIEKRIVGGIMKKNLLHQKRDLGRFIKT